MSTASLLPAPPYPQAPTHPLATPSSPDALPERPGLRSRVLAPLALAALAACARPSPRVPLCPPSPLGDAPEALADPTAWAHLLVPGFDLRRDPLVTPRACTGEPIDAPPPRTGAPLRPLPREPLTALDLSVVALDDHLLVWLRIDHFPDGDALGPAALVDRRGALEVTAIGPLRAPATGATLRRAHLTDGTLLLIAEGERCPAGAPCVREAHLLTVDGHRLRDLPLRLPDRPSASARVALGEADERRDARGWIDRRHLERRLVADEHGLTLAATEEITTCPEGHPSDCQPQLRRGRRCGLHRLADALVCVDRIPDR